VFRRPAARPKLKCVTFEGVQKDETIADGRSVGDIRLFAHESVTLLGTGNAWLTVEWAPLDAATVRVPVRIVFDEAVVEVQVEFGDLPTGPHAVVLQAHDERGLVAESRSISPVRPGVYRIRVRAPAITHVFLVPAFGTLHGVCVTTHARECAEGWGTLVAELPLLPAPGSKAEALILLEARVGRDVSNRYVRSFDEAELRYLDESADRPAGRVGELLTWLHAVVHAVPDYIENPDDLPHLRRAKPPAAATPLKPVRPQALLLLAALDPNIARLLSLGCVDRFHPTDGSTNHDPPVEGRAYDYKVVGHWPKGDLCGLLLAVGGSVDGAPKLDANAPVRAAKLAGRSWDGTEPRYRVGVRWGRPPSVLGSAQAVRPVAFDVWRQKLGSSGAPHAAATAFLTKAHPAVVPEPAWTAGGPPHLVDADVPRGTFWYQVAGIDLFGQAGPAIPLGVPTSGPASLVALADEEAPPAPSRLEARLIQPSYPWLAAEQRGRASEPGRLTLRFRYGAAHYLQVPDIASFTVRWPRERFVEVSARVVADQQATDARTGAIVHEYVVEVVSPVPPHLEHFVNIVRLLREGETRPPPRASLRIAAVEGSNRLRLEPSLGELVADPAPYMLVKDPHRRDDWSELSPAIPARPPLDGAVRPAHPPEHFGAMVVRAWPAPPPVARTPDPFALLPAGDRPELPAVRDGIDILIDRALLEPDLFTGGSAEAAGRTFDILASSSGPPYTGEASSDLAARIRLSPHDPVDLDDDLPPGA
jgi:hypothetical protein